MRTITRKQTFLAAVIGAVCLCGVLMLRKENADLKAAGQSGPPSGSPAAAVGPGKLPAAAPGKPASSPLDRKATAPPEPITLDLKSAEKLGKVEFIKDGTGLGIDPDFATIFKLTPEQLRKADAVVRSAREKQNETELAKITNLQNSGETVTFEIPFFPEEGIAIRKDLFEGLKQALPAEVFDYIQQNEERFFRYHWAEFGKLSRKFVVKQQPENQDGRKEAKWHMAENFFAKAADWAIKEGHPPEIKYGTRHYRFDKIPARYEHLISLL